MNSEWEQMAEDIRRSLEAVHRAHTRATALQQDPGHHTLQAYREELQALVNELKTLDYLIHHEIDVAMEDIGEILNHALGGHRAPHHNRPEIHNAEDK